MLLEPSSWLKIHALPRLIGVEVPEKQLTNPHFVLIIPLQGFFVPKNGMRRSGDALAHGGTVWGGLWHG